jgi:adenine phosphoribosyltransferase
MERTQRPGLRFLVGASDRFRAPRASDFALPAQRVTLAVMLDSEQRLKRLIRDIPDFPKPGILFRDITPLLADPSGLALSVELLANPFRGKNVDLVVGAESRGFIFGTAVARNLSAGFVPIRKPGKLPCATQRVDYELEYGTDAMEIHRDAINPGDKVLMIDDLLATGGTMAACCKLVTALGGEIVGIAFLIELCFLKGRARFDGLPIHSVIKVPPGDEPVTSDF